MGAGNAIDCRLSPRLSFPQPGPDRRMLCSGPDFACYECVPFGWVPGPLGFSTVGVTLQVSQL